MRDLGDLGVKVLHYKLQDRPHLRFVHPRQNHSMKSWTVAPSARLPKRADTGRRVSLNTQAPLTLPGTLSTARAPAPVRHAVTSLWNVNALRAILSF